MIMSLVLTVHAWLSWKKKKKKNGGNSSADDYDEDSGIGDDEDCDHGVEEEDVLLSNMITMNLALVMMHDYWRPCVDHNSSW